MQSSGRSSVVERLLAKQKVEGSNPFARSIPIYSLWRGTQVAKGEVCKTSIRRFESDPRLHPHSTSIYQCLYMFP